ncbi:ImmA/IrrE family metallo-endopeptidase [Streptomyces sp. NPDC002490]|uniref:ImmA/IrrE family metallo-endopeptidase n=1 Tax=Streptomyces sp. NPDC002490 TaxID=3154416 RepID=UPI00333335DB
MAGRQAHPGMLVLLRESRGLTQVEVSSAMTKASPLGATGVSQGYVSRAESGRLTVGDGRLEWYAAALGYPEGLLCLDPQLGGVGVGLIHHRKKAALSAPALRQVHAQLALTRIQLSGIASAAKTSRGTGSAFLRVPLDTLTTPKDAAREVRKAWKLAPGPVPNVIEAVEKAGALVTVRDLGSDLLDAVSQWDGVEPPLFLVNGRAPGDRCRFSVAHELGHLIMHAEPGSGPQQEKQADSFAAELLMPAADIRNAFKAGVDLQRLMELKRTWRVSMSALLRRALDLNALTEWQHRTLVIEMSALGYRTAEPVEIPREQPRTVPALVRTLLDEHGLTLESAATCARLLPEDFQHLYVEGHRTSPLPSH